MPCPLHRQAATPCAHLPVCPNPTSPQAVLKLHPQLPPGFEAWKQRLSDTLLLMVNGPHPAEQRIIAITWALVQVGCWAERWVDGANGATCSSAPNDVV